MSQGAITAGRLAGSVRPGRAADGYGSLIAARLRRLAGTGRTGVLPFAGPTDGALYFGDGRVVFAESAGTPGRVIGAQPVYRLMALRLLSAVDYPVVPGMRPLGELPARGALPVSFLRAVSTQNGGVR
jgi:hypothetical protein